MLLSLFIYIFAEDKKCYTQVNFLFIQFPPYKHLRLRQDLGTWPRAEFSGQPNSSTKFEINTVIMADLPPTAATAAQVPGTGPPIAYTDMQKVIHSMLHKSTSNSHRQGRVVDRLVYHSTHGMEPRHHHHSDCWEDTSYHITFILGGMEQTACSTNEGFRLLLK